MLTNQIKRIVKNTKVEGVYKKVFFCCERVCVHRLEDGSRDYKYYWYAGGDNRGSAGSEKECMDKIVECIDNKKDG